MAVPIIVIIDDDPIIVRLMERLLQKSGYTTRSWTGDWNVHALIADTQPNLLILDLGLGSISGWAVLEMVRLDPRTAHIPMIVCSGDSHQLQLKADHLTQMKCQVIQKPFNLQTLLDAVAFGIETPPLS